MLLAIIDAKLDGLAGVVKDIKEAVNNVPKTTGR
jgi:arabinogalactan endo-1,4-beta-galactosidase